MNMNQTCFETLTKIVQRIQRDLLSDLNDIHGRNRLLLTYIHYECTLHTPTETGQLVTISSFIRQLFISFRYISLDLSAISSKSASLRPSSLYLQRRVPRSTSNPDLPSPSLSPEDEMALAAANGGAIPSSSFFRCDDRVVHRMLCTLLDGSSVKPMGETSQGIVKDAAYASKAVQQRKVSLHLSKDSSDANASLSLSPE